ncbi:MAG TPA: PAS domain S-box protein [Lunatimonas sp.]|nr:PAS domain S-box protein [Lunatimonas sp.]
MNKAMVSYRVLVVEDNEGDLFLIEDYLREGLSDPEIYTATTFRQAKDQLSINRGYDLILLDLTLPDKFGKELIQEIAQIAEDICLIVLTGYNNEAFGIESLAHGVADYLIKDEITPSILHKSIVYSLGRKHASERLMDSEKRYRDLFHLSPIPMYLYCCDNYNFLDVNRAAINHYGYSKEEFLSMRLPDIRPREDYETWEKLIKKLEEGMPFPDSVVVRHLKKNGDIITVEIKGNYIDFLGEKAQVILAHDITDQVKYIETVEDQNTRLQEIAWMQSHVVRSPLSRLMGLVQSMDTLEEDLGKEALNKMILDSACELDQIIHQIVQKAERINMDK